MSEETLENLCRLQVPYYHLWGLPSLLVWHYVPNCHYTFCLEWNCIQICNCEVQFCFK